MSNTINKDTLTLPVPYTLTMGGDGTFIASWQPVVQSVELPSFVEARSGTSGMVALERLYGKLIASGVIQL